MRRPCQAAPARRARHLRTWRRRRPSPPVASDCVSWPLQGRGSLARLWHGRERDGRAHRLPSPSPARTFARRTNRRKHRALARSRISARRPGCGEVAFSHRLAPMKLLAAIAVVAASTSATAGSGAPPSDTTSSPTQAHVVTPATWKRFPSAQEMVDAYPPAAWTSHADGEVKLTCTVTTKGTLSGCVVLSESPSGQGFGEAAIKLSFFCHLKPQLVDGRPTETFVTLPIHFSLHRTNNTGPTG